MIFYLFVCFVEHAVVFENVNLGWIDDDTNEKILKK
jgi:hypothetical protein